MSPPTFQDRFEYTLARAVEGGVAILPERAADRVGHVLGSLVRAPLGIRRSTVEGNLARAFPDADPEWRERIRRESYRHLGREAVRMVRLSRLPPEEIVRRTEVPTWPQLEEALAAGKGALLITGHFGNWEVAAAAVAARGVPTDAVVKRQRNRLVDARIAQARARLGIGTIEMGKAPRLVPRALAANHAVGIVADQDARESGIWVPFFDQPASTFRGPALFALRFDAPVFAAVAVRLPDGRYRIESERLIPTRTGDLDRDVADLTARLAAHLEAAVRRNPEQYFWFHKRWKTRPPEGTVAHRLR